MESADILGLDGVRPLSVSETWARVAITAEHDRMPNCDRCGQADSVTWWEPWNPVEVADTPIRGRPATIVFTQDWFRCRRCNRKFVGRPDAFRLGQQQMTKRLRRFIENRSFRIPRSQIAAEVGIGEDAVDEVVEPLMIRLFDKHRFPTPRVIGMDDLHLNKKRYIVFTDAERGHPIGIIERADKDAVAEWLYKNLVDPGAVEVFVSDLHGLNVTAARESLGGAIHVADRWHVQRAAQKALRRAARHQLSTIEAEAAKLEPDKGKREKTDLGGQTKDIRSNWNQLIGTRTKKQKREGQFPDQDELGPVLGQHKLLSKAFYCRMALNDMYGSADMTTASAHLTRFYELAADKELASRFAEAVRLIRENEEIVLNYFRELKARPEGGFAGHTSGSIERRNQDIRNSWRAGRGVRGIEHLSMLALYKPWRLDEDIVECGIEECGAIEGPTSLVPGLTAQTPGGPPLPQSAFRCRKHAKEEASVGIRREPAAREPEPVHVRPFTRVRLRSSQDFSGRSRTSANDEDLPVARIMP